MSDSAPLSVLAQSLMEADSMPETQRASAHHDCGMGWLSFVFYFLVFGLVFYFLYFALRPSFVLKQHCHDSRSFSDEFGDEIDNGRLLAAAVISSLILIFVLWLLMWAMY